MMKTLALLGLLLATTSAVADRQTSESLTSIYRAYAFIQTPTLNPNTSFAFAEFEIPGLCETLNIQVFRVEYRGGGQVFRDEIFAVVDGRVEPFVTSVGGFGLMSAVVVDGGLYYSYSWGSGLHRSYVGRLRMIDRKLVREESAGYRSRDVFVRQASGNKVQVVEGSYQGFNRWTDGAVLDVIAIDSDGRLKVGDGRRN